MICDRKEVEHAKTEENCNYGTSWVSAIILNCLVYGQRH